MRVFLLFCRSNSEKGEGTVSQFSGKEILGVLGGPNVTENTKSKKEMDDILQAHGYQKLYEYTTFVNAPLSPTSCDPPALTDGPGNGPAAPAAVPRARRVGRLLAPMRGSPMLVRPRLANRVAGVRLSF
jgi:hypothetical protein